jgi:hypothetical protein
MSMIAVNGADAADHLGRERDLFYVGEAVLQ